MKVRINTTVYNEAKRVARDQGFATFARFAKQAVDDWMACGEVPLEVSGSLTKSESVPISVDAQCSAGDVRSAIERAIRIYRQSWTYRYPRRMLENAIFIEEYLTGNSMTFEEAQVYLDKMIEDRKKRIEKGEK